MRDLRSQSEEWNLKMLMLEFQVYVVRVTIFRLAQSRRLREVRVEGWVEWERLQAG